MARATGHIVILPTKQNITEEEQPGGEGVWDKIKNFILDDLSLKFCNH